MSYLAYKNIHLLGVFMMMIGYGSLLTRGANDNVRRRAAITHGIGTLISLIAGFGMLARLGVHWPLPSWIVAKVIAWFLLAFGIAPAKRIPSMSGLFWWFVIGIGLAASWIATYKLV